MCLKNINHVFKKCFTYIKMFFVYTKNEELIEKCRHQNVYLKIILTMSFNQFNMYKKMFLVYMKNVYKNIKCV